MHASAQQEDMEMTTRREAIDYCLTLDGVFEDYPFHDPNWCVIRHQDSRKVFAWIFNKDGLVWVNVKCDPQWRDVWRQAFASVIPAYHLNKEHWNSIILDGSVPQADVKRMICESYDLTAGKKKRGGKK
jgi:predicted DNA-binding protein (MmcQ/YjbR family)